MRLYVLLIGAGVALIAASVSARITGSWSSDRPPGAMQATQESLHWQCPDPSAGSRLVPFSPTFEVVNVGGTPVRILSVKTSCGCASARAEPLLVPPRGKTTVTVGMESLEVGVRAATITLETDSPSTPEVRLQLVEEGYRRPPYIFQLIGDLFYQEGFSKDDPREVVVDVVALKEIPEKPPIVTSELPFLRFGPPAVNEREYAADPQMVVRSYRFPVRFAADPPAEGFSGQCSVADPWVRGRILHRNVIGAANRPIRAVPSRLILEVAETGGSPARFLARSTRDHLPLTAIAEGDDNPLVVEAVGTAGEDEFHAFEVRWKPGREITEGVFNVIVGPEPAGTGSLIVPVMVRRRKEG